jgi:hypothetical protein
VTGCLSHLPTFGNRAHWLSGCEFVNGLKEVIAAQALAKALMIQADSMKSIVKSALDAFSAAAGTGVSTRGGHPATGRTAAHRAGRDIRSSRTVTRRTLGHAELGPTGRVEPDAGQRGVQHLLGRDQRVQVLGRAVLAIHRRACTRSTSSSGMSQANCATGTPGLLCYGQTKNIDARGTERPTGREDRIVVSDGAASHSPDVNPRDSGSITQVPSFHRSIVLFAKKHAADPPHAPGQPRSRCLLCQIRLTRRLGTRWLAPFASACSTNGRYKITSWDQVRRRSGACSSMRLPSAIRTFDPALFHQSPGRLDSAPMLGRGLPTNYPFGALRGALGIPPGLLETGHTGNNPGLVPLVQGHDGKSPAGVRFEFDPHTASILEGGSAEVDKWTLSTPACDPGYYSK